MWCFNVALAVYLAAAARVWRSCSHPHPGHVNSPFHCNILVDVGRQLRIGPCLLQLGLGQLGLGLLCPGFVPSREHPAHARRSLCAWAAFAGNALAESAMQSPIGYTWHAMMLPLYAVEETACCLEGFRVSLASASLFWKALNSLGLVALLIWILHSTRAYWFSLKKKCVWSMMMPGISILTCRSRPSLQSFQSF